MAAYSGVWRYDWLLFSVISLLIPLTGFQSPHNGEGRAVRKRGKRQEELILSFVECYEGVLANYPLGIYIAFPLPWTRHAFLTDGLQH